MTAEDLALQERVICGLITHGEAMIAEVRKEYGLEAPAARKGCETEEVNVPLKHGILPFFSRSIAPDLAAQSPSNRPGKKTDDGYRILSSMLPRVPRVPVSDVSHLMPRCWAVHFARMWLSRRQKGVCYIRIAACHAL
jgi:hypothetical protein